MPVLADVGSATFALVLALAVTIGLILWQTQRQWSRTYSRWRYREELEEPSFHSGVTAEELARWEVRMHELVRDLQGQLNTKIALVAELVAEAERVSRKLEELLQQAGSCVRHSPTPSPVAPNSPYSSPADFSPAEAGPSREPCDSAANFSDPPPISPKTSPEKGDSRLYGHPLTQWNLSHELPAKTASPRPQQSEVPPEKAKAAQIAEPTPGVVLRFPSETQIHSVPEEKSPQPGRNDLSAAKSGSQTNSGDSPGRFAAVFRLHELGLPPCEIARQTGMGVGEVELILRLRRFPQAGDSLPF